MRMRKLALVKVFVSSALFGGSMLSHPTRVVKQNLIESKRWWRAAKQVCIYAAD